MPLRLRFYCIILIVFVKVAILWLIYILFIK